MNKLSYEKQILILSSLVEGNSIRSIERISGVHRDTIMRLMVWAGNKAESIMDNDMINIKSNYVQVDEIWTYVAKKQKQVNKKKNAVIFDGFYNPVRIESAEIGDQYVFVAMDAETKLVPCYRIGKRNGEVTQSFLSELNTRIMTRFQLSSDSFSPYSKAVRRVFGNGIDYGQIHKEYAEASPQTEKRYSPAKLRKISITPIIGAPDRKHISTSYIERQNLTMRMCMRRFTRLTNAFSKKLENLKSAVSLHFFHYNYMRKHKTLNTTPCIAAGITREFWNWERFLAVDEMRKAV